MSKPLKSIPISSASTTKIPKTYRSKLYGNFSRLTKYYFQSRQFYSQEVINYCLDLIEQESANILDIGCGTGISTRQLAVRKHQLIGIDSSFDMIARASIPNAKNIKLVTAKAENLPVKPRIFDAVTAFGAFHWFSIPKAVVEIKRVLKLGGTLFIVNKTDKSVFLSQYR
ncbi:MAG: class I SAM-dependent methyltransferase, partial [Candidatus Chisholmbacteria bacterium]|nr:class I SAM-dependent methyltransferase [Candidatus Chisholmbacteria bacterium]